MKKLLIIISLIFLGMGCAYSEQPYIPRTEAKLEYNQGVDFYKVGQYDRAMACFRNAIDLDPNYIDAYYNLGSILEYLKQDDAALTVFKQIMVRKPDDYDSVYKAASLCYKLHQPEKAKQYLALIPPESSAYRKAQEIAANLNTDLQTIKQQQTGVQNNENKITQSNGMYDNIISPTGLTTDKAGNLYVAGFSDNSIIKITPDGKRIVFLKDSRLNGPIGMVSDNNGNIYIANYNNNNVLKVTNTGALTILISGVQKPYGLHLNGNLLFISCQGTNSILRYKLN